MSICDERLKQRALKAMTLQSQGAFLIDQRKELPFASNVLLEELRYSHERDEQGRQYDYQAPWGMFSSSQEDYNLLVLRKGRPPDGLWPQPRLELATAMVHTGFVTVNNNGSSFDLDLQTRDRVDYGMLRLVNQTLATERLPVVVWQLDEDVADAFPIIRIANDSAMIFASSAIWSPEDQQLVAAQVVTTSQELLKAIKATLACNNGKGLLTVKTQDDSAYLKGARRGFIQASSSLTQAHAEGTVTAMLHPLSGDPQAHTDEQFYLIVTPEENLEEKFAERLDLAIPWPVQLEWAEYLLKAGKEAHLVEVLPQSGVDFSAGLRIVKNESLWQQVISAGLQQGHIQIE